MKKMIVFLALLAGCSFQYPLEMRLEVQKNAARMKAYMKRKTTREQDRRMLKANAAAWAKLEEVVDGR